MQASVWHLYGSAFCLVRIGVPYVALGVHLVSPGFVCMQKIYFFEFHVHALHASNRCIYFCIRYKINAYSPILLC